MKLVLSLMRKESCEELATLESGRADEIVECISKVVDVVDLWSATLLSATLRCGDCAGHASGEIRILAGHALSIKSHLEF